jgi:hypothetical protein
MSQLEWMQNSNLEDSAIEFLRERLEGDSGDTPLTVFHSGNQLSIDIRQGFPDSSDWTVPVISLWESSTQNPRPFVGTTKIVPEILLIIQIRALSDRMRSDLARWVRDTINPGFPYYEYAPNPSNPDEPLKTLIGKANIQFLSDTVIRLANVDEADKFRHQFSVSVTIN